MKTDSLSVASRYGFPQWGIFSSTGGAILQANSVLAIEYARDYNVSDYPQEQGAFQSYNKVTIPYLAKITYVISDTRQQFLGAVEAAVKSLQLVAVITPDVQYASANLTHYDYRRQKQNVSLIDVTVWCREIRVAGQTQLTNAGTGGSNIGGSTSSTNGASTSTLGVVQSPSAESAFEGQFTGQPPDLDPPT